MVCARGAQQRLGIWPAPLYQSGSRRLADHRRRARRRLPSRARFHALRRRGRRARGALPLLRAPDGPLLRTQAGEALLARLRSHRGALAAGGYHFGAPRLAVRVGHPAPSNGCVYCGHCLDGCPYGHIYNDGQTLADLREKGLIEYRSGLHEDRISERDGEVLIEATALAGGRGVTRAAPRVFLAAGVLSTTIILQRSGLLAPRAEIADSKALYCRLFGSGPRAVPAENPRTRWRR